MKKRESLEMLNASRAIVMLCDVFDSNCWSILPPEYCADIMIVRSGPPIIADVQVEAAEFFTGSYVYVDLQRLSTATWMQRGGFDYAIAVLSADGLWVYFWKQDSMIADAPFVITRDRQNGALVGPPRVSIPRTMFTKVSSEGALSNVPRGTKEQPDAG